MEIKKLTNSIFLGILVGRRRFNFMKKGVIFVGLVVFMFMAVVENAQAERNYVIIKKKINLPGKKISITFKRGKHWLHSLRLFSFISVKNPPQIAIWLEDMDNHYLETLYVTKRSATQNWRRAPGDKEQTIRRDEALPVWSHRRGIKAEDGSYMPDRLHPLPDAVTSATPKHDFVLQTKSTYLTNKVVLFVELNSSCDFNEFYTKDASVDSKFYSGGAWGSGQPSLIYKAVLDPASKEPQNLVLVGHGHPAGKDGTIDPDVSTITTALDIVHSISVEIQE